MIEINCFTRECFQTLFYLLQKFLLWSFVQCLWNFCFWTFFLAFYWFKKCLEKKLDWNYSRMLHAVVNKSWKQHPTKQHLYSHSSLISQTIQERQARHDGHCWRSKDKLISDILLRMPSDRRTNVSWPAETYIHQLCVNTGCGLED